MATSKATNIRQLQVESFRNLPRELSFEAEHAKARLDLEKMAARVCFFNRRETAGEVLPHVVVVVVVVAVACVAVDVVAVACVVFDDDVDVDFRLSTIKFNVLQR